MHNCFTLNKEIKKVIGFRFLVKAYTGRVLKGLGKGRRFLGLSVYRDFFADLLGEQPYPGTLNLHLNKPPMLKKRFAPQGLGAVRYSLGILRGIRVLVIKPERSVHPSEVVELVSPWHLRTLFNLNDYSKVTLFLLE